MKVLVDTSIWSLALRRKSGPVDPAVSELEELIREFRVSIIGPVRQEILSAICTEVQFEKLREILAAFPDLPISSEDYEEAARFYNRAMEKGIQGSNTDFLICAVAERHNLSIFTADGDFELFRKHLPVKLHQLR